MVKATLRSLLIDFLRVRKIVAWYEVGQFARKHGFKESTAERAFRKDKGFVIPCKKLNHAKKPLREGDAIGFYRWDGGKTFLKKYEKELKGK